MENKATIVEKVHCDKCQALRTITEYKMDQTAVLDCGHIIHYNKDTQSWQN